MGRRGACAICLLLIPAGILIPLRAQRAPGAAAATPGAQYPAAVLPNDGQWPLAGKNFANTRFSELDQINTGNVKNLRPVWTFATGVHRGHEGAPVIANDTMYLVSPYPNIVFALDPLTGKKKWSFLPNPDAAAQGVACCDTVNRGVAYSAGKLFFNTLDVQTWALDANTGRLLWRTKLGSINKGETITMAPLAVNGKVIVGNSGGELGIRGWVTALDANSGKIVWRAYGTGPDAEVLIGPRFKPFYKSDTGENLGVATWPPGMWNIGGGGTWGFVSYDPALNLVYYGTANPGPWNSAVRPGDNKWTSGVFARDADTGEAVWYYQYTPHDDFDYDGINEHVLIDTVINGRARRVFAHPDRNGHMYVLDRVTGEVISARTFAYTNTSFGVSLETGRLLKNPAFVPKFGKTLRSVCPAAPGGKDWPPSAYSPRTGLLYIPHNNLCMDWELVPVNYIGGTPFIGTVPVFYAGPGGNRGEFTAWDVAGAKPVWNIRERFPCWSGALATAGDVVFYGTMDRWFKAVNARTGELLWKFQTGSGVIGQPVTFLGRDGKQYVAVFDGVGGWPGSIVSIGFDPADPTAGGGFAGAMSDLPFYTPKGGTLYVFALP